MDTTADPTTPEIPENRTPVKVAVGLSDYEMLRAHRYTLYNPKTEEPLIFGPTWSLLQGISLLPDRHIRITWYLAKENIKELTHREGPDLPENLTIQILDGTAQIAAEINLHGIEYEKHEPEGFNFNYNNTEILTHSIQYTYQSLTMGKII